MPMKKKKTPKTYKTQVIYDDTFRATYHVSYGMPEKQFVQEIRKLIKFDDDLTNVGGICSRIVKNGSEVIWVWTRTRHLPDLVHECLHAVSKNLRHRGIQLDNGSSEETYCYALGMLIGKIR